MEQMPLPDPSSAPATSAPARSSSSSQRRGSSSWWVEILKMFVIVAMIVVPLRAFVIQPFLVDGDSMEPNISSGQYLLIDQLTYRFRAPERGEVVVLDAPHTPGTFYIKRVIGVPGDTVEVKDGLVVLSTPAYPDGVVLEETYLNGSITPGDLSVTVPDGHVFVLGDNRSASSDSRVFGAVPYADLVGRAWVKGLPVAQAGTIDQPEYPYVGDGTH